MIELLATRASTSGSLKDRTGRLRPWSGSTWPTGPGRREAAGQPGRLGAPADHRPRFDPANHLDDLDDVAGYLAIALEESGDDPTALPRAPGVIARSQNMSELARRVGMSRDRLYKTLSAKGDPTWSTILKVTNALGLRFELHSAASRAGHVTHVSRVIKLGHRAAEEAGRRLFDA